MRTAFSRFSPKSDWERFFSDKISIADIKNTIEQLRLHRNNIAHFKFFYKDAYKDCNQIISQLNKAIIDAIQITEQEDFLRKNLKEVQESLSIISTKIKAILESLLKPIEEIQNNFAPIFNDFLIPTNNSWLSQIVKRIGISTDRNMD